MHVVRDRDMEAYTKYVWRSYQLSNMERSGMMPEQGTPASDEFHESLYSSLDQEGELWECPGCGRLLFRRPGEQQLRSFLPEKHSHAEKDSAPDRSGE